MPALQKTVMIIEDEPDAAEMFAEMMRVNGFRVLKMFASAPAIPLIVQEKPDLVILDIMLPDISGLEVLRYMRREPELTSIPVIVVSAKSMPADIKIGIDAGASMYLTKPVGFLDLKQAVEQVLPKA
jgi:DNA-binding response OmpR family regulator